MTYALSDNIDNISDNTQVDKRVDNIDDIGYNKRNNARAQIIGGTFGRIIARQKSGKPLEIGEILVTADGRMLLQVVDLIYGSQVSQQNLEMISGMDLEEHAELELFNSELRTYTIAILRPLVDLSGKSPKELPEFLSYSRDVKAEDLKFLTMPENALRVGMLRSGSRDLGVELFLDGKQALSHHILISATTGRGKSNLLSCMLWDATGKDFGLLVLDPHDEYYGRNETGLKDHPSGAVCYYTVSRLIPSGARTLKINIKALKPWHFNGVVFWTDAQSEALAAYYRRYNESWIKAILHEREVQGFMEGTIAVLKRRMMSLLDIDAAIDGLYCSGVFDDFSGETTVKDIATELESGKTVIVDTSQLFGAQELLIGSMISWEIFNRYKSYKADGSLSTKPVISVVLEEAPRVLGKEILERGSNIFSTIAREGRKFQVGLTAITQMPSLIPRTILANMNTKIIMGIEMKPEREAIIDSASHDLSQDDRNIASLGIGEAIVTSTFTKFAVPVKIPRFADFAKSGKIKEKRNVQFSGITIV